MPYYEFCWDERTLEKLSINDVTVEEVEEVICYPERVEKSRSSGIPIAIGAARDGRLIACVYQPLDELTVKPSQPITSNRDDHNHHTPRDP